MDFFSTSKKEFMVHKGGSVVTISCETDADLELLAEIVSSLGGPIEVNSSGDTQAAILEYIERMGPSTADEISEAVGRRVNPRLSDMVRYGLLVKKPLSAVSESGRRIARYDLKG